MPAANDMELVRDYARRNSESAFAELVRRHINLVYSVAVRFTGNPGDAADVTQAVFILLARKAANLSNRTGLTGWFYETTRLTAAGFLRSQNRRRFWEQEACMESDLNSPEAGNLWRQLAPHLEAAMSRLGECDRTLLALRFYENKTGAEAAALLGIREEAAHKRTARALEKLRNFFAKRGVSSTTAIIANEISANSIQAAPVALAKAVTAVALAKGATASVSTLTLIKGALKIMAGTKTKTTVVASVGILLATGTTVAVLEAKAHADREKDFVAYAIQHQSLTQRLFARQANDSETRRQLEGVWIITDKRFQGNPRFAHYPKNYPHLKTWTLTNWAIVTYDSKSNVVYSASGPYELSGSLYTETVELGTGNMTNYIGTSLQYRLRVQGNRYYQMGSGIEETGQRLPQ